MQLCFENTAPRVYLKPIDIQHIDGEGVTISLLSSKSIVHTAYFNWEKSEPDGGGWRGGNSEKEVIRGGEKNKGRLRPTEVIIESDSLYPMPFIVSYILMQHAHLASQRGVHINSLLGHHAPPQPEKWEQRVKIQKAVRQTIQMLLFLLERYI